jgi:hypothetical protein
MMSPNEAIPVGRTIFAPLRKARTAKTEAAIASREKILAPVCDETTHSLTKTHSLFRTKPNVVFSFPGVRNPKNRSERTESIAVTETPTSLRFSTLDLTFPALIIRSTP